VVESGFVCEDVRVRAGRRDRVVAELLADSRPRRAGKVQWRRPAVAQVVRTEWRDAGVSPNTVHNWLSAGRLERFGVSGRPLVSRDEFEALIAARAAKPARKQGNTRIRCDRGTESTFSDLASVR